MTAPEVTYSKARVLSVVLRGMKTLAQTLPAVRVVGRELRRHAHEERVTGRFQTDTPFKSPRMTITSSPTPRRHFQKSKAFACEPLMKRAASSLAKLAGALIPSASLAKLMTPRLESFGLQAPATHHNVRKMTADPRSRI